jgi:3-oxoacyl-[acyl-carrier protein] reductase
MKIIVSGGTRGIGKEVVLNFAGDKNNQILVIGRNEYELTNFLSNFNNIHTLSFDLTTLDKQADLIRDTITQHFERVDILINMAGLLINKKFIDLSSDETRSMMETNFFGTASLIRIVKPFMTKGSHIINISSMGGFQGSSKYTGLSIYSASKAALACLSECLAEEFRESGISVNCLALGAVQTEMFAEAFPGYKAPVEAKEMAEFICGFALNGNRFFNGKIIPVAVNNP